MVSIIIIIIIIGLSWVGVKMCFRPNGIAGFGDLNFFLRYLKQSNSSMCNSNLQIGFLHMTWALCFVFLYQEEYQSINTSGFQPGTRATLVSS